MHDLHASLAPELADKLRVCAFGVDPDDWSPTGTRRSNTIVLYQKDVTDDFTAVVEAAIRRTGAAATRVRYGAYTRDDFRAVLDVSRAAVFLSSFETQGLALAEAWAMDVRTLVWNPQADTEWRGHRFQAGSSAPYLTSATGLAWRTEAELDAALRHAASGHPAFTPRAWVLAHMTDAICAHRLYEILTRDRE
ncbi:MAG: hypothetical protein JF610_17310 [Acidobacteria bacterium]|nr:hypothetical protein [Acidobacteriota bacterium]